MTWIIIIIFIFILGVGFREISLRFKDYANKIAFASEYRDTFIDFSNNYFQSYDRYDRMGKIDSNKYIWLTKNVGKIQNSLGHHGRLNYLARFRTYQVSNYEVVINTLPKFRDGSVDLAEAQFVDDSILRYGGAMEELLKQVEKQLKNPVIWFREGVQEFISLPLYLLNWFGIIPENGISKITTNFLFRIITGIGALVAFASGLVTIIQGKQATLDYIHSLFRK